MRETKINFFTLLVVIFLGTVAVFYGRLLWQIVQEPKISKTSLIPALPIDELNKVNDNLEKRSKLLDNKKIDLSRFQFGRNEPFIK